MYINCEDFKKLFESSKNVSELAIKIGWKKYRNGSVSGTAHKDVRRKCEEFGFDYKIISNKNNNEKYDNILIKIVPESHSIWEVMRKLGKNQNNGSFNIKIKKRIKFLGLDTSHFTGKAWCSGKNRFTDKRLDEQAKKMELPWNEVFKKYSKINNSSLLKRLILSEKREYKCYICGLTNWNKKPIRLRLDHIDGNNANNEENNLRLLCPNCDSQEDTFCRGTRKKSKEKQWWQDISK